MQNHETEGLLSPFIRDIRLKQVASRISSSSVVLDLACGAGYLKGFLPESCRYYGIDRIPPPSLEVFDAFADIDLLSPDLEKKLSTWLPERPDIITMVAFVEHIKNPEVMVARAASVLKDGGRIIITTPHPMGRIVHDTLAKIGILSRGGAEEHEVFLGKPELLDIAKSIDGAWSYRRFLLGLNQVFTIAPSAKKSVDR